MNKLVILICVFSTQFAFGQTDQFDEILNYYNSANEFNGTVVVATDGQIDYLKAIGLSDRQQKKKSKLRQSLKLLRLQKLLRQF